MKVFLSWSGELSHDVARVFAQMLPVLFEDVDPFEASDDIEKGKRWGPTLATVLSECSYGIICLTRSNLNMPWIMFEAGALSKLDTSHVAPFLLGLKPSEVKSPLADFQITSYNEEDVKRLIRSINASLDRPRADANLERSWRLWWPDFKAQIDSLEAKVDQAIEEPQRDVGVTNQDTLEEILELVREQRRLLSSPEALLPRHDLASFSSRAGLSGENRVLLMEAHRTLRKVRLVLRSHRQEGAWIETVFASTTLISRALASAIVSGDKHPLAEDRFVDEAVRRLRAGYTPVREDLTVADAEEQAAVEEAALNDWLDDAEQANPNSPDELSAQP
jgi:hypothetical protein